MLSRGNRHLGFAVDDAVSLGLNEAIFVQHLRNELNAAWKLRQNGQGEIAFALVVEDGQPWMPWTNEDFCKEFPFWSGHQIRRIIASCKGQGLVKTANYNQNPWDRRLWYTVEGESIRE